VTSTNERARQIRALVLDVEGTTTPVSFVYDVLFPFAREHLNRYLAEHADSADVHEAAAMLAAEWSATLARGEAVSPRSPPPGDLAALSEYLNWLMDRDQKSPGLKLIQGLVWEEGYRDGRLRGQVFPDVVDALARWKASGLTVAIYSSGSVLAQRLLFAHTEFGDLTPMIARNFDTAVGAKRERTSYASIAASLEIDPAELAFVSDVDAELEAAVAAGCRPVMCVRPGNAATSSRVAPTIDTFDELDALLSLVTAHS
jgi:enolase-phosphatase E1